MSIVCAISGSVPQNPVVAPSGAVFERRLIEQSIAENGKDPTNGEELSADDLIELKATSITIPRAPGGTSIPNQLKAFQDEWDAHMLETYTLRQHIQSLRQELTHALYQHDAACRVIARLTRERDQARQALESFEPSATAVAANTANGMEGVETTADVPSAEASGSLPGDVVAQLNATCAKLSAARKKRSKPATLATQDNLREFAAKTSNTGLHQASKGCINEIDLQEGNPTHILTAGDDKTALLFDVSEQKVVATLKGHTRKVTSCRLHPVDDIAVTGSSDQSVRVWEASSGALKHTVKAHKKTVTGISIHPTGNFVASSSDDGSWAFIDINSGEVVAHESEPDKQGLSCIQWHPDGLIFGVGANDGTVRIWDIMKQEPLKTFEGHSGKVTALAFSENGYYLASAAQDGTVKLWNLRDLSNIRTLEFDAGHEVNDIAFDKSGSYLAVGGTDVRIYTAKKSQHIVTITDHTSAVTSVRWGPNAQFLASASSNNTVKYFS